MLMFSAVNMEVHSELNYPLHDFVRDQTVADSPESEVEDVKGGGNRLRQRWVDRPVPHLELTSEVLSPFVV